jgi:RNA polymerase sigma factor (sigma-70 family)
VTERTPGAQRRSRRGVPHPVATVQIDAAVDDALVASMIADLDTGFARLVEHYAPVVASVTGRVSGRVEDAEDLSAETFFRAYRALRDYSEERLSELQVRPWLVTIALNLARNTARARARRPQETAITEARDPRSGGREPAELALAATDRDDLARRLAALSMNERVAVVLRHVVEMPVAEIAAVLGCKEVTARSHIARGLAHLRASYEKDPTFGRDSNPVRTRRGGER